MLYEPAEDSYLLQKYVKKYSFGTVLDVGTGSGIQAVTATANSKVTEVLAVDIQKSVVEYNKKENKHKKITWKTSDLFSKIKLKEKFDTIIFNPPYLPEDKREDRQSALATTGGKKGYELLVKFLNQVADYLSNEGIVFIVFSSLTKKAIVDEAIEKNLLKFELVEKEKIPFEELYCYKITKSKLLKELHIKKVSHINYLTRGKRGVIFTGVYKKKKIAIKANAKNSTKIGTITDEVRWLKKLNKHGIGAKYLFSSENYLAYEFVEGMIIKDFISTASKKQLVTILKKIFEQCVVLDKLHISKEEMHHPYKHVIVHYPDITLLDFERAHTDLEPNTLTQFLEYLARLQKELQKRGIHIDKEHLHELGRSYKQDYDDEKLRKEINKLLS